MDIKTSLQKFDLSEKEAELYLAGLKLGASPVQKLAEAANVKRSSAYFSLDNLKKIGLINEVQQGRRTMYEMKEPEKLQDVVKESRKKLIEQEMAINEMLPAIKNFISEESQIASVKHYDKIEEIKDILFQFFVNKEKLYIIGSDEFIIKYLDKIRFFEKFLKRRIEHNNNIYIITDKKDLTTDRIPPNDSPHYKYNKQAKGLKSILLISGNKYLQIHLNSHVSALFIENKPFLQIIKYFFNFIWNNNKK